MKPQDPHPLAGGWASQNLTPEEQLSLAEAALRDQTLFDQLAEEEPLRALLAAPEVRAEAERALEPTSRRCWWLWAGASGVVAALVLTFAIMTPNPRLASKVSESQIAQQTMRLEAPLEDMRQQLETRKPKASTARKMPLPPKARAATPVEIAGAPPSPAIAVPSSAAMEFNNPSRIDSTRGVTMLAKPPAAVDLRLERQARDGSKVPFEQAGTVDPSDTVLVHLHARQALMAQLVVVTGTLPPEAPRALVRDQSTIFSIPAGTAGAKLYRIILSPAGLLEISFTVR